MADASRLVVAGRPTGTASWRRDVATAVGAHPLRAVDGVAVAFTLRPGTWVDVDTLAENTLRGLRDAAVLAPRLAGLDALIATKAEGPRPGATIAFPSATAIARRRLPGPAHLDVRGTAVPRSDREAKRQWRATIAAAWDAHDPLDADVFADVSFAGTGSLVGALEVVLDALEPVLGRDPRGRDWQEFFPNDHRIVWLRVRRGGDAPVRLQLGPLRST